MKKTFIVSILISFILFVGSVKAIDQVQEYVDNYAQDVKVEVQNHNTSIFNSITPTELIIILSPFIAAPILITIALFSISKQVNRLTKNVNKTIYGYSNTILDNYKEIKQEDANKIIDNFDINKFNEFAYKIFCNLKISIMNLDFNELKKILDDELYNFYKIELDSLKEKNQREFFQNFELLCIKLISLEENNDSYIAKVGLNAKFYDYVESSITQNILMGSKTHKSNNNYILTFIISKDKINSYEWKLLKEEKLI